MKKLILLVAAGATFCLGACSDDKHTTAVHHARVVHHTRSTEHVNAPADNGPDNFEAVERPATYSR